MSQSVKQSEIYNIKFKQIRWNLNLKSYLTVVFLKADIRSEFKKAPAMLSVYPDSPVAPLQQTLLHWHYSATYSAFLPCQWKEGFRGAWTQHCCLQVLSEIMNDFQDRTVSHCCTLTRKQACLCNRLLDSSRVRVLKARLSNQRKGSI